MGEGQDLGYVGFLITYYKAIFQKDILSTTAGHRKKLTSFPKNYVIAYKFAVLEASPKASTLVK